MKLQNYLSVNTGAEIHEADHALGIPGMGINIKDVFSQLGFDWTKKLQQWYDDDQGQSILGAVDPSMMTRIERLQALRDAYKHKSDLLAQYEAGIQPLPNGGGDQGGGDDQGLGS